MCAPITLKRQFYKKHRHTELLRKWRGLDNTIPGKSIRNSRFSLLKTWRCYNRWSFLLGFVCIWWGPMFTVIIGIIVFTVTCGNTLDKRKAVYLVWEGRTPQSAVFPQTRLQWCQQGTGLSQQLCSPSLTACLDLWRSLRAGCKLPLLSTHEQCNTCETLI